MAKKKQKKRHKVKWLEGYKAAPYNPRKISAEALGGLAESIQTFGDLSGLVVNSKTRNVVCGHQRRLILEQAAADLSRIRWSAPYTLELGYKSARFESQERRDTLITADGLRFGVREVCWLETFEKAANLAANNPAVQGEFTDQLQALLEEIQAENPQESGALRLDTLIKNTGEEQESATSQIPQAIQLRPPREYVLVMCADDAGEEFEELKALLSLTPVRRGGYKAGSTFDHVGTQRVVHACDLIERLTT